MAIIVLLLVFITNLAWCAEPATAVTLPGFDPAYHEYSFTPGDSLGPFDLPVPFLIKNSTKIFAGERLLSDSVDYRVDEIPGKVWLIQPEPGVEVKVQYRAAALGLDRRIFRMRFKPMLTDSTMLPGSQFENADKAESEEETNDSRLSRSGSILRAVTVGTGQDVGIESALRLQIDGNVTQDMELHAVLSDQTGGIPPEGNTKTLKEFDKIFIQAKSPTVTVNMGDYGLEFGHGNQFATTDRQVQGAELQYRAPRWSAEAAGAITRAKFRSIVLTPSEGNQGPYLLTDDANNVNVPVVPGSERVYLDGTQLTRGETEDFVIDYSTGELTFTPKRPIHDDSRLRVEYETIPGNYNRGVVASQVSARAPGKIFDIGVVYFREADDIGNPVGVTLDSAAKAALGKAGSDPNAAVYDGAKFVGTGKGDYVKQPAPGGTDSIFVFAEPDTVGGQPKGDWTVGFSRFPGAGAYRQEFDPQAAQLVYRWVGSGLGDYLPQIRVPLPEQHDLLGIRSQLKLPNGIYSSVESAYSDYNPNQLSYKKVDRNGGAIAWTTGFAQPPEDGFSRWHAQVVYREVESNFLPLERNSGVDEYRRWGSTDTLSTSGEVTKEASIGIQPVKPFQWNVDAGDQVRGNGAHSTRFGSGAYLTFPLVNGSASVDKIKVENTLYGSTDNILYLKHKQAWQLGFVVPSFSTNFEDRVHTSDTIAKSGTRRWENVLGFDFSKLGVHHIVTQVDWRNDWNRDSTGLVPAVRAVGTLLSHNVSSANVEATTEWNHRDTRYLTSDSGAAGLVTTDLVKSTGNAHDKSGAISGEWSYSVNKTRSSRLDVVAYRVPLGQGDHVLIGGQYIPSPEGDWIVYTRPSGAYDPVLDVESVFGYRMNWDQFKPYPIKGVSTDTRIEISEQTKTDNTLPILLLDLRKYMGDSTLYGKQEIRQEVDWDATRKDRWRLRWDLMRERNNRMISGAEDSRRDQSSLLYRQTASQNISWSLEGQRDWQLRNYVAASLASRDALSYELLPELTIRYKTKHEWRIDGEVGTVKDRALNIQWQEYGLTPSYTYYFTGTGRIFADLEYRSLITSSSTVLPYDLTEGRQNGSNWRWSVRGDFKIGSNVNGSISYNGVKDNATPVRHEGRAEMIAFF